MSKRCPETVVFAIGEKKHVNFDFSADLGPKDIAGVPSIVSSAGGPLISNQSSSGKFAQAFLDATTVAAGEYTINAEISDNSTPVQVFKGQGRIVVGTLG